jgi:hypothetical protein
VAPAAAAYGAVMRELSGVEAPTHRWLGLTEVDEGTHTKDSAAGMVGGSVPDVAATLRAQLSVYRALRSHMVVPQVPARLAGMTQGAHSEPALDEYGRPAGGATLASAKEREVCNNSPSVQCV